MPPFFEARKHYQEALCITTGSGSGFFPLPSPHLKFSIFIVVLRVIDEIRDVTTYGMKNKFVQNSQFNHDVKIPCVMTTLRVIQT